MLEAILYYFLQRGLGSILEGKGYGSVLMRVLFVSVTLFIVAGVAYALVLGFLGQ